MIITSVVINLVNNPTQFHSLEKINKLCTTCSGYVVGENETQWQ